MPTPLYYPSTANGLQKTLDASLLTGVTASATLNNVTGIQNLKGVMVIDRVDGNNKLTPDKREYISFAGTSGSTVVTLTRGLAGSTDQDHAVGAIVEFVSDVTQQQAIIDGLLQTVNTNGALDTTKVVDLTTAQTLTNKVLGPTNFSAFNAPQGFLINGKIVPSVASNNLTVAIKGLDGNDPSASNPVYCRIGDTVGSITSALSVTKNAGTNWFGSGSTELATNEIDYFVYLGYNSTDGVVIGFSTVPYCTQYQSFSVTTTNRTYGAISTITHASANDAYEVIGRFAATLSAGAGYTWTVPTYTTYNLIQRPIYDTRWLTWTPTFSCSGSMTFTSNSINIIKYKLRYDTVLFAINVFGTTGGTASTDIKVTIPFPVASDVAYAPLAGYICDTSYMASLCGIGLTTQITWSRYDHANWGLGANRTIAASGQLQI